MKKIIDCFVAEVFVISNPNILSKGVHHTHFEKKLIYFWWKKGLLGVNLKKQKKVNVTVLIVFIYSIWIHVESSKYKMICLKSPKSSEFAICRQKSLTMFMFIMFIEF